MTHQGRVLPCNMLLSLFLLLVTSQAKVWTFNIAALVQESYTSNPILSPTVYQGAVPGFLDPTFLTDVTAKGVYLWQEQMNSQGGSMVGSDRVLYNVTWFNVAPPNATSTYLLQQVTTLMHKIVDLTSFGKFGAVICLLSDTPSANVVSTKCEQTGSCVVVYPLVNDLSLLICSGLSTQTVCQTKGRTPGQRQFDYTFSMLPDPGYSMAGYIQLMRFYGVKTLSIIAEDSGFGTGAASGSNSYAASLGITTLYTQILPASGLNSVSDGVNVIQAMLDAGSPDAFILIGGPSNVPICVNIAQAMHQLNWMPKSYAVDGPCSVGAEPTLQSSGTGATFLYSYYQAPWDASLRGQNYHVVATDSSIEAFASVADQDAPQTFTNLMISKFQGEADDLLTLGVLGASCAILIQKGIESSGIPNPTVDELRDGISRVNTPSVIGQLEMDITGRLVSGDDVIVQINAANSAYQVVMPLSSGNAPVFPTPTWDERQQDLGTFDTDPTEYIVTAVCVVAIAYVLSLALLIIYYRDTTVVRAATPEFCLLCLAGTLALLLTPFSWSLHDTTASCITRVWLLQLGFTTLLSALIIKTFRIWRISDQQKLRQNRITLFELFVTYAIVISVEIVFTLIWTVIAGSSELIVVVDPLRPSENYTVCSSSNTFTGFAATALAIKCVMIIVSVFLGWKTRKTPGDFNESGNLALMAYNIFFLLLIGLPIIISGVGSMQFSFYIRSFALVIIGVSTASLVVIPKLFIIRSGKTQVSNHTEMGKGTVIGSELMQANQGTTSTMGAAYVVVQKDSQHRRQVDRVKESDDLADGKPAYSGSKDSAINDGPSEQETVALRSQVKEKDVIISKLREELRQLKERSTLKTSKVPGLVLQDTDLELEGN